MKPLLLFQLQVLSAPLGVTMALQHGTTTLLPPVAASSELLVFETELGVVQASEQHRFRLSGPCVHGRGDDRFLYLNAGTYAGQADSCWSRRAKVPLPVLTAALVEQALATPDNVFRARMWGCAGDGGPACASIRLLDAGWSLIPTAPTISVVS
ncbi:DUF5990 family protein [Hymenobacter coalescens]